MRQRKEFLSIIHPLGSFAESQINSFTYAPFIIVASVQHARVDLISSIVWSSHVDGNWNRWKAEIYVRLGCVINDVEF